jgi:predicted Zn-dependent protease
MFLGLILELHLMSTTSAVVHGAVRASSLFMCVLVGLTAGCKTGPDSGQVVKDTVHAWSTDSFVPPTDPAGASKNAARVLSEPERPVDKVMQVGSAGAVVHSSASVTSKPLARLEAFDAVRVVAEADFIRVAPAAAPKDTNRQAGNMKEYAGADAAISPTWVRVKAGSVEGWVPARALSNPLELAMSSDSMARARAAKSAGSANKGFSEKMKVKSTAMKGAAGTPQLKGANYKVAGEIADRIEIPMMPANGTDPFAAGTRAASLPTAGQPLASVDAGLAAKAAEVQMAAMNPPSAADKVEGAAGLLGGLGIKQADDPNVKLATEVARLYDLMNAAYPITPVEERVLGLECLAMCIGDSKVLPESHPVAAYVRWVGSRVASPSSMPYPAMGLEFIVIDDPKTTNAMAVPGGPIVITTGMLEFLDNEDELAVILAHEVGHIEERHGLKQAADAGMEKYASLASFASTIANGQFDKIANDMLAGSGLPADLQAKAVSELKSMVRSGVDDLLAEAVNQVMQQTIGGQNQGIETAADLRGMSLAAAAGYNPVALEALLERIKALSGSYGGANYSEARVAQAREVLAKLPMPNGGNYVSLASGGSVTPSAQSAANWQRLDAELKKN